LVTCLLIQIDYLNKALDLFNTAVVSPIYYVMFTLLSIVASIIMFQVGRRRWELPGGRRPRAASAHGSEGKGPRAAPR
jgi:hypothetical protein